MIGDDNRRRWLIKLKTRDGGRLLIDSVNVKGADDFEHKTQEFVAVFEAIHQNLAGRDGVRYLYGTRRGIYVAWRIALVMLVAAGIFGVVAAVVSEEYDAILYAAPFVLFGVTGLLMLKGRRGPRPYDPSGVALGGDPPAQEA